MSFTFDTDEQFWMRGPQGRAFYTPEEMAQAAMDAFAWLHTHPKKKAVTYHHKGSIVKTYETLERPFTLKGVLMVMGLTYTTFQKYRDRPEFAEVVEWIDDVIYTQKFEGAATGLLNSNIIVRDLGLADKSEVSGGVTVVIERDDADL